MSGRHIDLLNAFWSYICFWDNLKINNFIISVISQVLNRIFLYYIQYCKCKTSYWFTRYCSLVALLIELVSFAVCHCYWRAVGVCISVNCFGRVSMEDGCVLYFVVVVIARSLAAWSPEPEATGGRSGGRQAAGSLWMFAARRALRCGIV